MAKLDLYLANPRSLEEMKAFFETLTGKPLSPEGLVWLKAWLESLDQKAQQTQQ